MKYELSEKAFLDVWKRYGSPEEINGEIECIKFLKELIEVTNGWVIVDHFSLANYDHISKVNLLDGFTYIYWKDFEENPLEDEWDYEVFGYATYIYTLCRLRKLQFVNIDGHLLILFYPNAIPLKQAKKILKINLLEEGKEILIDENHDDFETRLRFIKNGKIHECFLINFPFFSFLIQPKQRNMNSSTSRKILMYETINYTIKRVENSKSILKFVDDYDNDEIQSVGNRLRSILESLIKYYCLYFSFSLPKRDSYADNMLGNLRKHLLKNKDNIVDYFDQEMINIANDFSHDTGNIYYKKDAINLINKVEILIKEILTRLESKKY